MATVSFGSTAPYEPEPAPGWATASAYRPPPPQNPFDASDSVMPPPTRPGGTFYPPGTEPPTSRPPAQNQPAFSGLNQNAIMNYLRGLGAPSTANLISGFPGMLSAGLVPQGSYLEDSPTADEIFIPGYGWLDTMRAADTGNPTDWQYLLDNGIGGGMGGFGNYWSDPMLQQYTDFGMQAIARLMSPQGIHPVLADALAKLNQVFAGGDKGYDQFQQIAHRRLQQLRQPLFGIAGDQGTTASAPMPGGAAPAAMPTPNTPKPAPDWLPSADGTGWVPPGHPDAFTAALSPSAAGIDPTTGQPAGTAPTTGPVATSPDALRNSAILRANFVEPLMQQRSAAQQRALERASARGLGLSSGLTEEMARGVDQQFDQQLAEGYRNLMLYEIEANEGREQEAVGIGQLLASLGNQQVPAQLSAAGQIAGIGSQLHGEELRNMMAALGVSQGLAQMPLQQMLGTASVMNTLGNQPVPQADPTTGIVSLLMGLAGQGEGAFNNAMNQEGGFWQALLGLIPGLIDGFQPDGATT